ncbi:PspC domain-containing protein [candidate division WOR-3 bacterium]|nr:PspC domain-containing protein [candidate division WOR-3 bacterium]
MKRLYRSKKDKLIGGVCGGIGEYFNVDSVLIRVLLLLFTFLGGAGVLAYIIAWIVIPSQEDVKKGRSKEEVTEENDRGAFWGGIVLVVIGLILILFTLRTFWIKIMPLVLIAIGIILIFKYKR